MADTEIPKLKTYEEGEPIPPVDPENPKRRWSIRPPWTLQALQAACSPGADVAALLLRWRMIDTLIVYKLLEPWQHGEELDDAVFRIAATFPLRELRPKHYMIPGDEHFGFDPNAFVQRLIEETGISHVWKPVTTKVPEGGRAYSTFSAVLKDQVPNPEREAKREARDLLWHIWSRCADLGDLMPLRDRWTVSRTAELFDNFVKRNDDLLREVESEFRTHEYVTFDIMIKVEQRAQGRR